MTDVSELIVLACAVYIGVVFKDFMEVFMEDFVYPLFYIRTVQGAFNNNRVIQRVIDFLVGLLVVVVIIRISHKPFLKLISIVGK